MSLTLRRKFLLLLRRGKGQLEMSKNRIQGIPGIPPADEDVTFLRNLNEEPIIVMPVDSLIGDPIEFREGFYETIPGDKTKAGFVDVVNNGQLLHKHWHTRHCPTGSPFYYHKCEITVNGKLIQAWELEVPNEEGG